MCKRFLWMLAASLLLMSAGISSSQAQASISVSLPPQWDGLVEEAIVEDFEAQYSVDVFVAYNAQQPSPVPDSVDAVVDYSEDLNNFASAADVLYVSASWLSPEITRAGYFLDLQPLVSADINLNPDDYYSAVWQSFQWDNAMWALPSSAQVYLVDYLPEAFDEAGLSYPTTNWTIDDFANAARTLAEIDENGDVTLAGMTVDNTARRALLHNLAGMNFYNGGTQTNTPTLYSEQFAYVLEVWGELLAEGVLAIGAGFFGPNANDVPLRIGGGNTFTIQVDGGNGGAQPNFQAEQPERSLAPLPGGQGAVIASGFAVSSGSSNPQLAYELARYLTAQQTIANASLLGEPARRSYTTEAEFGGGVQIGSGSENRSLEDQALVETALESGIPSSELRYSHYLSLAVDRVTAGLDGISALQEAEIEALGIFAAMSDVQASVFVETIAPLTLDEGEIALNFSLTSFINPLPNQEIWDELIADFVAQDAAVGAIVLDVSGGPGGFFGAEDDTADCSYYPSTLFADVDPDTLFALDPLFTSDPNYNAAAVPPGVMDMVQASGMTYGLPITILPQMLNLNVQDFELAGVQIPSNGWTTNEFEAALQSLSLIVEEGEAVFSQQGPGNAYLYLLIAAQGGVLFDFSTDPVTLDFTSLESIAAVQTVLGWIEAGYIEYETQGGAGGGFAIGASDTPITASTILGFNPFAEADGQQTTITIPYPTGVAQTPVSFDVGAGYISQETAYPEACYRWLSFLANHPHLFFGSMPALQSTLNDPVVVNALGADTATAYQQYALTMAAPDAVQFITGDPFIANWAEDAFNTYLTQGVDLQTALEDAQRSTQDYLACTQALPEDATFQDLGLCAQQVDATQ